MLMVNYIIVQELVWAVHYYEVQGHTADKSVTQLEISKEGSLLRATLKENWLSQKNNQFSFNAVRVVCSSYAEGGHTHEYHTPVKDTIQT